MRTRTVRNKSGMNERPKHSPWDVSVSSLLLLVLLCALIDEHPAECRQGEVRSTRELQSCIQGGVINWATQKAVLEYSGVLQSGVQTNQTQELPSSENPGPTECRFLEFLAVLYYSPVCIFSRELLSALEHISGCFPEIIFMAVDANPSSTCEYLRPFQAHGFPHSARVANLSTIGVVQVSSGNSSNTADLKENTVQDSMGTWKKLAPLPPFAAKELNSWTMCSSPGCLSTSTISVMSYPALIFVRKDHRRRFSNRNIHDLGDFLRENMIRSASDKPSADKDIYGNGICYPEEETYSRRNQSICPVPISMQKFSNIGELVGLHSSSWINITDCDLQKTEKNRQCYDARQKNFQNPESSMSRVIKPCDSWSEFRSKALELYIHNPLLLVSAIYLSLDFILRLIKFMR